MKLTRAIRTDGIAAALWLAWAIITPIDWLLGRHHQRQTTHRAESQRGEVRSVVGVGVSHGEGL